MSYLLDTNVLSELMRQTPDRRVVEFLEAHNDLWVPSIVIHEIEYGILLLPHGSKRALLSETKSSIISAYADRIIPLDRTAAEAGARMRAEARRSGRIVDIGDALIAGTAQAHDLGVATRNVDDFEGLDVDLFNPWEY